MIDRYETTLGEFDGDAELDDGATRDGFYGWRWRLAYSAWRKGEHPTCLFERADLPTPEKYRLEATVPEMPEGFELSATGPETTQISRPFRLLLSWIGAHTRAATTCAVIVFATLIACGTAVMQTDAYRVAREKGFAEALRQLSESTPSAREVSPKALFHRAYLLYGNGQLRDSEELTLSLLESAGDRWMQGKCYYLLGLIKSALGESESGVEYLTLAVGVYGEFSSSQSLFLAEVELGLLTRDNALIDRAGIYLEGRSGQIEFWADSYILYSAKADVALLAGHYGKAQGYAEHALAAAQKDGNTNSIAWAMSDLSIILAINDRLKDAKYLLIESNQLNIPLGDETLHYKGLIAQAFIRKCSDAVGFELILTAVEKHVRNKSAPALRQYLELLERWSCDND